MRRTAQAHRMSDALYWTLLYAALWALFAEGAGWSLGMPSVLLAAVVSLWLGLRPLRLRLRALPGFAGFFLRHMLIGAGDVASRALRPRCPLQPAWHDYPLASSSPRVRLLLSALVGLLPGTLASGTAGEYMRVHVLDERQPWRPVVAELEQRLQRLLGDEDGR